MTLLLAPWMAISEASNFTSNFTSTAEKTHRALELTLIAVLSILCSLLIVALLGKLFYDCKFKRSGYSVMRPSMSKYVASV